MSKGLAGFEGGVFRGPSDSDYAAARMTTPDNTPKDFEKVPAFKMKDGRILSREQALVEVRKEQIFKALRSEDSVIAAAHLTYLAKFIAERGDKILSILQQTIKDLG